MPQRSVWVQVTDEGEARTWHLEGLPGETRCRKPTQFMKNMPKADWGLVLRPCTDCQRNADLPLAAFQPSDTKDPESPKSEQHVVGRHARRESEVA
jgi:hypothetical protein